jgi:hypothetical protein
VKVGEGIEHRPEHVPGFGGAERALGKDLGEVFFRVLHHHIKQPNLAHGTASGLKDGEQVGMRKASSLLP